MATEMESMQSSMPPLPGTAIPESFTPADLLSMDSKRSPKVPNIAVQRARRNMKGGVRGSIEGNMAMRMERIREIPIVPPIKPAMDLFGEHFTYPLLFFPNNIPVK